MSVLHPGSRNAAGVIMGVVLAAVSGQTGCAARTARPTTRLDPASCNPVSNTEAARLSPDWQSFLPHTMTCRILDASGKAVLSVVTVSADRLYAKAPAGAPTVDLPKPVILSPDGSLVATLPYAFPDDPPFALEVTFADWERGFPRRVELFLRDPTVSGDHALNPLVWDETERRFVRAAPKRASQK